MIIFLAFSLLGGALGYYASSERLLGFVFIGCFSSLLATFVVLIASRKSECDIVKSLSISKGVLIGNLSFFLFVIIFNIVYADGIPGQYVVHRTPESNKFLEFLLKTSVMFLQTFPGFIICSFLYGLITWFLLKISFNRK